MMKMGSVQELFLFRYIMMITATIIATAIVALVCHRSQRTTMPMLYYVINMDHETTRYDRFTERYETAGLPWSSLIRFPAIRGSGIDVRQYMSESARTEFDEIQDRGFRTQHHQLSAGAVGVWLSHVGVWRSILASGVSMAMVFEDDAIFDHTLVRVLETMTVPEDADIVLLGHQCMECSPSPTNPEWYRVRRFYELHGYVITARGAQKALERVGPLDKQIDSWLSDLAGSGHLVMYASKIRGLVRQDKSFQTSIQTPINLSSE